VEEPEVYPNAPVVLVAIEARHTASPPMSTQALARAKQLLGAVRPLSRVAEHTTVTVAVGGQAPEVSTIQVPRFMNREQTLAVSFRNEALVVETTDHERYEHLRYILGLAVEARQSVEPVDGLDRLGLRYIDEIRVPDLAEEANGWAEWVSACLLGPLPVAASLGLATEQWQGIARFTTESSNTLVLRYGPRQGFAVDPAGDLKRPTPPPGPFFLLDVDSFWSAGDLVPPFEPEEVLALADVLHKPVRSLFESLITDRLRDEVLRHAG
jgi:uncharacterized protein (TIGR04255 family)